MKVQYLVFLHNFQYSLNFCSFIENDHEVGMTRLYDV